MTRFITKKMIVTKIVIKNFHEKLRKLSWMPFSEIQIKKMFVKNLYTGNVWNIKVASLKFKIPTAWGLTKKINPKNSPMCQRIKDLNYRLKNLEIGV